MLVRKVCYVKVTYVTLLPFKYVNNILFSVSINTRRRRESWVLFIPNIFNPKMQYKLEYIM